MTMNKVLVTYFILLLSVFCMGIGFALTASADDTVVLQVRNEVEDKIMLSDTPISIKKGDTVLSVLLQKFGKKVSCRDYGIFKYVAIIDGLEEYEYGPQSGWVYEVNENRPDEYPGAYKVKSGDKVVWAFVRGY